MKIIDQQGSKPHYFNYPITTRIATDNFGNLSNSIMKELPRRPEPYVSRWTEHKLFVIVIIRPNTGDDFKALAMILKCWIKILEFWKGVIWIYTELYPDLSGLNLPIFSFFWAESTRKSSFNVFS